jgi:hypothetical protein
VVHEMLEVKGLGVAFQCILSLIILKNEKISLLIVILLFIEKNPPLGLMTSDLNHSVGFLGLEIITLLIELKPQGSY